MWEPRNVLSQYPSVVLDHYLEFLELENGNGIESYVEQDECPFEEGVGCVSWDAISGITVY